MDIEVENFWLGRFGRRLAGLLAGIIAGMAVGISPAPGNALVFAGAGVNCTDHAGVATSSCNSTVDALGTSTTYGDYGVTATGYAGVGFTGSGTNWTLPSALNFNTLTKSTLYATSGAAASLGLANDATAHQILASQKDLIVLDLGANRFRFSNLSIQATGLESNDLIRIAAWEENASGVITGTVYYSGVLGTNALIPIPKDSSTNASYEYIGIYATRGNVAISSLQFDVGEPSAGLLLGGGAALLLSIRRRYQRVAP